jgi:hypothetical protein
MDEQVLTTTRRSLHGVAESLLAGPQYRAHGTIRLRITPGGFGGAISPERVAGAELVWPGGRTPLAGSCRELAERVGVEAGPPEGVYGDTTGFGLDAALSVDPEAAAVLADWFARGDAALRTLSPDGEGGEAAAEPVLWPEHFDLGITLDEVNYGISPGDAGHPGPYAYVGPWTPRTGPFWNASFGALRPMEELPDVDAVARFLAEGRVAAR